MLGLIIDLERKLPDAARHTELRTSLINVAPIDESSGKPIPVETDYIHFTEIKNTFRDYTLYDFLILSPQGSPWKAYRDSFRKALEDTVNTVRDLILEANIPTLGICGGHQFLAVAFGGKLGYIDSSINDFLGSTYPVDCIAEKGPVTLMTLKNDPIFEGITSHPGEFSVMQNHIEEVKTIPPGFINLAYSRLSQVQIIRLQGKVVYGVAFHPERGWSLGLNEEDSLTPKGKRILLNFLKIAYAQKSC